MGLSSGPLQNASNPANRDRPDCPENVTQKDVFEKGVGSPYREDSLCSSMLSEGETLSTRYRQVTATEGKEQRRNSEIPKTIMNALKELDFSGFSTGAGTFDSPDTSSVGVNRCLKGRLGSSVPKRHFQFFPLECLGDQGDIQNPDEVAAGKTRGQSFHTTIL